MKTTMTITLPTKKAGEVAYFTIEFLKADFLKVIDAVEEATLENVTNNNLWRVI